MHNELIRALQTDAEAFGSFLFDSLSNAAEATEAIDAVLWEVGKEWHATPLITSKTPARVVAMHRLIQIAETQRSKTAPDYRKYDDAGDE